MASFSLLQAAVKDPDGMWRCGWNRVPGGWLLVSHPSWEGAELQPSVSNISSRWVSLGLKTSNYCRKCAQIAKPEFPSCLGKSCVIPQREFGSWRAPCGWPLRFQPLQKQPALPGRVAPLRRRARPRQGYSARLRCCRNGVEQVRRWMHLCSDPWNVISKTSPEQHCTFFFVGKRGFLTRRAVWAARTRPGPSGSGGVRWWGWWCSSVASCFGRASSWFSGRGRWALWQLLTLESTSGLWHRLCF